MPAGQKKGAPKIKRAGRHKAKIERYYAFVYPRRKIRHLLKHNGWQAAWKWAEERNLTHMVPPKPKE